MKRFLFTTDKYDDKYYSTSFQCPDTGVPVHLIYNETRGAIFAEIDDYDWNKNSEFFDKELDEETKQWCDLFHEWANTKDIANYIAEKYDCWFE